MGVGYIPQKDVSGRVINRIAATEDGWHYQAHYIELTTGLLSNGFVNDDEDGNDLGFVTMKFYDSSDVELTTQLSIDSSCVKTVVDWMPDHDYDIVGAFLVQNANPVTSTRLYVKALPDFSEESGGSKMFAQGGINLKYIPTQAYFDVDGRAGKRLDYNGGTGTNKIRLIINHSIGLKHTIGFFFEIFKP